jgi:hypothetical protein
MPMQQGNAASAVRPQRNTRRASAARQQLSKASLPICRVLARKHFLIQRFDPTRLMGHGTDSRPSNDGGSTGRHESKAAHALIVAYIGQANRASTCAKHGWVYPKEASREATSRVSPEGNNFPKATLVHHCIVGLVHDTCYFPVSRATCGLGQDFTRVIHGTGKTMMTCLPGQRFSESHFIATSVQHCPIGLMHESLG